MAKFQIPTVGGIRKVLKTSAAAAGTTIAGLEGTTITIEQLAALLGVTIPPNTGGGNIGTGDEAAIALGPGLAGGGPVVGTVPIRLTTPLPLLEDGSYDEPMLGLVPTVSVASTATSTLLTITDNYGDTITSLGTVNFSGVGVTVSSVILSGDASWTKVGTLITFDSGPPWTDISNNALVYAATGTFLDTGNKQFGAASADFASVLGGGSFGGIVQTTINAGGPIDLSSGDYTIEGWFYNRNSANSVLYSTTFNNHISLLINATVPAMFVEGTTLTAATVSNNAWHHLALVMSGNNATFYIDGVATAAPTPISRSTWVTNTFYLGGTQFGASYAGNIDEFRITKGVARYSANFTPPAVAFPTGPPTAIGTGKVSIPTPPAALLESGDYAQVEELLPVPQVNNVGNFKINGACVITAAASSQPLKLVGADNTQIFSVDSPTASQGVFFSFRNGGVERGFFGNGPNTFPSANIADFTIGCDSGLLNLNVNTVNALKIDQSKAATFASSVSIAGATPPVTAGQTALGTTTTTTVITTAGGVAIPALAAIMWVVNVNGVAYGVPCFAL